MKRSVVPAIQQATEIFLVELKEAIEARVYARAVAKIDRLRIAPKSGAKILTFAPPRKKAPVQLCPSPGCVNRAAPVFGMLCASHKGTPKATVTKWRAARRARKGR